MALSSIKLHRAPLRRIPQGMLLVAALDEIAAEAETEGCLGPVELLCEGVDNRDVPTDADDRSSESSHDPDADYYDSYKPHVEPVEDSWVCGEEVAYDPSHGLEWLRWMMEGVKARDIRNSDIEWVVRKHLCLSAAVLGGLFSQELIKEPSMVIGRYAVEIGKKLRAAGIEHKTFGGITDPGYARLAAITGKTYPVAAAA